MVVAGTCYEGQDLTDLVGSYHFADWSSKLRSGGWQASTWPGRKHQMKGSGRREEITIAGRPMEGLESSFAPLDGMERAKIYLLTSEVLGPSGDSGKIYKLVRAEDQRRPENGSPHLFSTASSGPAPPLCIAPSHPHRPDVTLRCPDRSLSCSSWMVVCSIRRDHAGFF